MGAQTTCLTLLRKGNTTDDKGLRNCKDLGWHGTDNCYCPSHMKGRK